MERITLAPGAHINVLPAEKFNRCRISINFIWPAAREWATAEALLPLVLERGYQGCPDMTELSKKLARLYGAALSVDGTMSGQSRVLTVSLSGIRDAFALAGEPLSREYADIAFGTAFEPYRVDGVLDAEAVAIEKEQLRELLEGEINEKRSYCIRQARRRFYGDSPAGIERNGYLDEVDGLTADAVTRAYARMVEQAQIEVFVLGADVDAVAQRLRTALSGLRRAPEELPAPIAMPAEEPRSFEEPLPTVQGKLCMLFTPGEPFAPQDLSALRVAVALLGGTPTSRLFQNVREKQSLCYYCAASYTSLTGALCGQRRGARQRRGGPGVHPERAGRAVRRAGGGRGAGRHEARAEKPARRRGRYAPGPGGLVFCRAHARRGQGAGAGGRRGGRRDGGRRAPRAVELQAFGMLHFDEGGGRRCMIPLCRRCAEPRRLKARCWKTA
ncbi:MAG: M16 family metallopeptidase [Ruthenibacterium lactatiformans]